MKKKSPTVGQQRLAKLARYLHTVPAEKFWMHTWRTSENLTDCGSTACAVGHAATIFESEGFYMTRAGRHEALRPFYDGLENWRAIETFFDLRGPVANLLFGPDQDIGPRGVSKRIKRYLKTGKI